MRYGVYVPNFGPYGDGRTLANLALDAENAGWDGFFVWDHITRKPEMGSVVDPWVALAAIAVNTQRIRIGAMVTPLPRRRPWKIARETVSLDHLSDGRLIFGVGIGSGRAFEWENLGEETDPRARGAMLDEGLDILAGLWSGEPFSYDGQYYRVKDAHFLPPPVQSPRIPVWVGGNWPHKAPLRRAALWDGAFVLFREQDHMALEQFDAMIEMLEQYRQDDKTFDIVFRNDWVAPSESAGLAAQVASRGATWWLEHIVPQKFGKRFEEPWPLEAMHELIRMGPPRV